MRFRIGLESIFGPNNSHPGDFTEIVGLSAMWKLTLLFILAGCGQQDTPPNRDAMLCVPEFAKGTPDYRPSEECVLREALRLLNATDTASDIATAAVAACYSPITDFKLNTDLSDNVVNLLVSNLHNLAVHQVVRRRAGNC